MIAVADQFSVDGQLGFQFDCILDVDRVVRIGAGEDVVDAAGDSHCPYETAFFDQTAVLGLGVFHVEVAHG